MNRQNSGTRAALLTAALVMAGCYTYVPMDQARVGVSVRVGVPVTSSVGSSAQESRAVMYEGLLVGVGDTLLLETRMRQTVGTHGEFVSSDTIRVRRTMASSLEERVLSKGRTALLTAGLVGGAALAFVAVDGWAGGGEGDKPDDGGPSQGSLIVRPPSTGWQIFSYRIPFGWSPF
jgi:hypothetical protein